CSERAITLTWPGIRSCPAISRAECGSSTDGRCCRAAFAAPCRVCTSSVHPLRARSVLSCTSLPAPSSPPERWLPPWSGLEPVVDTNSARANVGALVVGGQHPGLGVARSLGRRGIPVVVIDDQPCVASA